MIQLHDFTSVLSLRGGMISLCMDNDLILIDDGLFPQFRVLILWWVKYSEAKRSFTPAGTNGQAVCLRVRIMSVLIIQFQMHAPQETDEDRSRPLTNELLDRKMLLHERGFLRFWP